MDSKKKKEPAVRKDQCSESSSVDSEQDKEESAGKEDKQEIEKLVAQVEEQRKSIEELEAKNSRLRAEFHNFKKAVDRETQELLYRAEENLLFKLLGLYEDLERALDHTEKIDKNFLKGVRMIHRRMLSIMQEEGIEEINPETGKLFDPFLHEVSETVETDSFEEMAVVEVEEKGYSFKSKVLKPAKVIVAVKPKEKKESEGE
jgi:molecular chaperone GrpE